MDTSDKGKVCKHSCHRCNHCNKCYSRGEALRKHMKVHDAHTSDRKRAWEAIEQYKGKEFKSEVDIMIGIKKNLAKLTELREKRHRINQLKEEIKTLQKSV